MKDKSAINYKKSRNRGSVEQETKVPDRDGSIMAIATKDVISIPPSKSIKETAEVMMKHEFRRLPVTDPGSGKLLGFVTVMDILDFLGGGNKFNIIVNKYEDNFLAAINEPIRQIMSRDLIVLSNKDSIEKTIDVMLENQIGAVPIVDSDEQLVGIVTERDIALSLAGVLTEERVQDYMSTKVFTTTPGTPVESASKIMVRNRLRRIPIIGGEADISKAAKKLLGIITSTDIIRFLNAKDLFENLNSNLASDVLNTKLSDIMVEKLITVPPTERLGDLCQIFLDNNIGGVPVVKNDEVVGIITERDILRAIKRF
ncbi:hypoxic response protein 1 [Methanobrevibacter woesei]|jgi:CBS domain-containing protein|uniref:Hypoxic response protein 1 n=1 Tax=Methanobrevibacter woesei TaxID=190976 RepID=A0A2U1S6M3_9EURY|nr:CBS domain-containing protein [Methanobrevibacter woesei]MCC9261719.1 CBS domain-containing protein [Methanobrevibacter woesei]PWB85777.1 hypoxic response protein 1 [Methanobrevibacter woesei]